MSRAERRVGQREEWGRERRVEKREGKAIALPLLENLDALPGPTHAFITCR